MERVFLGIKPCKTQLGGFLGPLLASVGIPIVLDMIKKMSGGGSPRTGSFGSIGISQKRVTRSSTKSKTSTGTKNQGETGAPRSGMYQAPQL